MIPVSRPQKEFIFSEHPHPAMIGGLGCVHPSTKIYTEYGLMRICDINRPMRVLSWNQKDQKFQLSFAGSSFPKGEDALLKVSTNTGSFIGASSHSILLSDGEYYKIKDLKTGACLNVVSKDQLSLLSCENYSQLGISKEIIISIDVDIDSVYYDMQVLDTNNYICENGFIHHNSGKSQAGTYRLVKLLLEEKGLNVSHFFPSYRLAKRRGLPGVCEHLKNEYGLKYLINKSDLTVYVPEVNGTIYLESYHDPNSIVAYAIAHGVTDELDTLPKEQAAYVWQKITERVRQKCKRGNTLACVTTPDQGVNGFCYEKWGDGQHIDKGYHYIKAGTNSNKFLPEGYADQISKNYDPITAEAFLNGGWVSFTQNKVYHFFDRKKHHTTRVIGASDSVIHIGIDFNIGGCCANVFIVFNNNPVAVDEFVSYDTRDFISNLAAKYRGKTCIIYPDASGAARKTNASQSDIELIKNAGYQVKVNHSNPAIRDRINIFNGLLAHDRLKINTDKCPLLTNALETQGYDKNGDPEKFDNHPAIDDFVDNSGYFLAYAFPIIRPVTQIRVGGGL